MKKVILVLVFLMALPAFGQQPVKVDTQKVSWHGVDPGNPPVVIVTTGPQDQKRKNFSTVEQWLWYLHYYRLVLLHWR